MAYLRIRQGFYEMAIDRNRLKIQSVSMLCEIFNEHTGYNFSKVEALCNALETFSPIHYDQISIAFLTEKTICQLHERFLNNPDSTDVITFPANDTDVEKVGEICISVDEALKHLDLQPLADELTLYLVHGWLHLANYDDILDADRLLMREMERKAFAFLDTRAVKRIQCNPCA